MIIEARDRIVDYDDLVGERLIMLKRREEERQRERVAVARAQDRTKLGRTFRFSRDRDCAIVDENVIGAS